MGYQTTAAKMNTIFADLSKDYLIYAPNGMSAMAPLSISTPSVTVKSPIFLKLNLLKNQTIRLKRFYCPFLKPYFTLPKMK